MYDPYADFTRRVLPNGLEVFFQNWSRPWMKVEIVVHAGAREDPLHLPGLAHYVEHMVSDNIPGWEYDDANAFLQSGGGRCAFGSTQYLATRYKIDVPAETKFLETGLDIFGSMLLQATLERELDRERQVIESEFNESYPHLKKLEWEMASNRALYRGHRFETYNRPIGRPEGFFSATAADLQAFYDRYYVPANLSLVCVGGVPEEEFIRMLLESPFGVAKPGVRNPVPEPFTPISPDEHLLVVRMSDYLSLDFDRLEFQADWALPVTIKDGPRYIFSAVLWQIMFEEIREKRGLSYGMKATSGFFQDIIEFTVSGKLKPKAEPQVEELVRQCIDQVPRRPELFEQKKARFVQKANMVDLSGGDVADISAKDLITDRRIVSIREESEGYRSTTFDDLVEIASLLSPERQFAFLTIP